VWGCSPLRMSQADLLRRLKIERTVAPQAMDLFHQIRITGNQATHGNVGDHSQALTTLKVARQLAIWFHKSFGKQPDFKAGRFVPPPEPEDATASLRGELEQLRTQVAEHQTAAERARSEAEAAAQKAPAQEKADALRRAEEAAKTIDLDEREPEKAPRKPRGGRRRSEPPGSSWHRRPRPPNSLSRNSWRLFRRRRHGRLSTGSSKNAAGPSIAKRSVMRPEPAPPGARPWLSPNGRRRAVRRIMPFSSGLNSSVSSRRNVGRRTFQRL